MIHTIEHAVGFVFYAYLALVLVTLLLLFLAVLVFMATEIWQEWWVPRRQQARFIAEVERHLEDAA